MNTDATTDLAKLFPQFFELRNFLQFGCQSNQIYAERTDTGKKYSLNSWQNLLMMGMDGNQTFGAIVADVEEQLQSDLRPDLLVTFVNWLLDQGMIQQIQQPILDGTSGSLFELVAEDEEGENKRSYPIDPPSLLGKVGEFFRGKKAKKIGQNLGILFIGVGLLRAAWVVAPIFEPVVDRIYVEVGDFFHELGHEEVPEALIAQGSQFEQQRHERINGSQSARSERNPAETVMEDKFLAGSHTIEQLRQELAACRVRRDEHYLQNNEDGYRREVEKMSEIAKQIGLLELTP